MKFAIHNSEIALLEQQLHTLDGSARLYAMMELAWHLRQRDCIRALALCTAIEDDLATIAQHERDGILARLALIRAEERWLFADLDAACKLSQDALALFQQHAGKIGMADAYWLLAMQEQDRGNMQQRLLYLLNVLVLAAQLDDPLRAQIARVNIRRLNLLQGARPERMAWVAQQERLAESQDVALSAWAHELLATYTLQQNDFRKAATEGMQALEAFLVTGQLQRAMTCGVNVCYCLTCINDSENALEWANRTLDTARKTGWPSTLGAALSFGGEALRRLGKLDIATEFVTEALQVLACVENSRQYLISLRILGDIALSSAEFQDALRHFRRLERHPYTQQSIDFQSISLRGQAHALLHLDQPELALNYARLALENAESHGYTEYQINALRVLVDIYQAHPGLPCTLPLPDGQRPSLYFLLEIVKRGEKITSYIVPADVFERIAGEYADQQHYQQAFLFLQCAIQSREKTHSTEVAQRAVALQIRVRTEKIVAENEYSKRLAQEQGQRAELLQHSNDILATLGLAGREITSQLDGMAIYKVLYKHVTDLLDAPHFAILLLQPDGRTMFQAYGMEYDQALADRVFDIDHPAYYSARCAREQSDLLINRNDDDGESQLPGTAYMRSLLYCPLNGAGGIFGVMTVQSPQKNAYGERELLIFRSLCAYGAIALDNAHAYKRLQQAQYKLVEQEKMAALGALVAGVAHELNTPIGNSLLVASTINEQTQSLQDKIARQNLRRLELQDYVCNVGEGSRILMNGLSNAASMISSFKQVAVDRTSEHRRVFNLQKTCLDTVAALRNRITNSGHQLQVEIPPDIEMNSYPGPLSQVLTCLIENALIHAFEHREHGKMELTAQMSDTIVTIQFSDYGNGISPFHLSRIFEPFFTTRLGQGGSGLGLSISYNIVTSILCGQISAQSTVGKGTRFFMQLPRVAHVKIEESGV